MSRGRRARAAVWSFPFAFLACIFFAWAGAEVVRPDVADPGYLARRDLLRQRLQENPGTRLAVVLGSSRMGLGFVPEALPPAPADRPLWFNMAHFGSGPVFTLVTLDRLHRDGIRPDVAVIEVMPPFVVKENPRLVGMHLSARELAFAAGYHPQPDQLGWHFFRHRFLKVGNVKQVFDPLGTIAPPGWYGGPPVLDVVIAPEERARRTAGQQGMYAPATRNMTIPPGSDRALRDTLARCRERGITPVLLLAPEGPAFRSWYDPAGYQRFEDYLGNLAREHGVRLIDARDWLTEDDFTDSHHPLQHAAIAFTKRLVGEVQE